MRWKIRLGLPLVFSAGCAGHAEYVTRRQDGGVLRLVGARGKANADARDHMAKHCGPVPHQIVEEGEAVVGSDTAIGTNTDYRGTTTTSSLTGNSTTTGNATTRGTATTRDATEWRVHYQCQATLAPSSPSPPTYFCTTSPAEPSRTVCRPTMAACAGDQARLVREGGDATPCAQREAAICFEVMSAEDQQPRIMCALTFVACQTFRAETLKSDDSAVAGTCAQP